MSESADHSANGPVAVPGVAGSDEAGIPSDIGSSLEVDGELFLVRPSQAGGWFYDWLTGPNPGYGFGEDGPSAQRDRDEHLARIRNFLAMIDPATGYIRED